MGFKDLEENGMRARSFRYEDYNNRRVFLRSYPLHWGESEEEKEEMVIHTTTMSSTEKKPIKKIILSVVHWGGGKVVVLRRFRHKVSVYVIACIPVGLKSRIALLSA
ncbi:hypothetical protein HS088_TW06G00626 [Tripterygium wilfordii]|uniref:Uncharacterized protein n=1 Tax=Tripterygium wilfordii TaxID=458696 RepID=A0A7J7DJB6_TRIWF|nr:hypothetical protein HS088_TW06G00626 [Tripterygium wilfordii]